MAHLMAWFSKAIYISLSYQATSRCNGIAVYDARYYGSALVAIRASFLRFIVYYIIIYYALYGIRGRGVGQYAYL